jgi:Pentapeptide repeats (8 copies)
MSRPRLSVLGRINDDHRTRTRVDLHSSCLYGAQLDHADLRSADLSNAFLEQGLLREADLTDASLAAPSWRTLPMCPSARRRMLGGVRTSALSDNGALEQFM